MLAEEPGLHSLLRFDTVQALALPLEQQPAPRPVVEIVGEDRVSERVPGQVAKRDRGDGRGHLRAVA